MDKTVQITVTTGNVSGETQFEHGLGYVPAFVGMIEDFADASYHSSQPLGRVPQPFADSVRANSGSIYVSVVQVALGTNKTYTMKVIVFRDKIAAA